jgi:hypothetical protein
MDFEDAEKALRVSVGKLRGWTFERFEVWREPAADGSLIQGPSGQPYLFETDVTDRSGDYDPKDELLELEFTVSEQGSRRIFRASVTTIVLLRKGEVFSGEITEVSRTTARVQRVAALALSGLVTAFAATLFYRCGR